MTEEIVYYRVKLIFKHATQNREAGESLWLWRYVDNYGPEFAWWQSTPRPEGGHRFTSIKAAREAAKSLSREDYGGDKCCERVIERVTETVERITGVKAPAKKPARKKQAKKKCGDCRRSA